MGITVSRRDTCRLCGSGDLELVLPLVPTPLADDYVPAGLLKEAQPAYPLDLFLCRNCGFSQLLDVVSPEDVYCDYIYETTSSLGLVDHFKRYADEVLAKIDPPAGALVIDLGSNDGTLLRAYKNRGLRVLGVDPAREIARKATESGVETLAGFFTAELAQKIRADYGPAAIITANNLFANVDDLNDMTAGIKSLLAPDGVFIFESFYLADQIENMVFDFTYHEHLSYFSVKPLALFFRDHGMELIDAQRVPTKGGSLRYTAQLAGGRRPAAPSITELEANESRLGIHDPAAFRAFNDRIEAAKGKLRAMLSGLKAEGKTVAGYGASATTTTLVYHFGLGGDLDFIADDYPAKQNLYSPGFHIPVLAPEALYEKRPDYVLILAWRYYQPIIDKHSRYVESGGRFIVPLPDLKVIPAPLHEG